MVSTARWWIPQPSQCILQLKEPITVDNTNKAGDTGSTTNEPYLDATTAGSHWVRVNFPFCRCR